MENEIKEMIAGIAELTEVMRTAILAMQATG